MTTLSRRSVLGSLPLALGTTALTTQGRADPNGADDFSYEITRTDEEWRAMLTEAEYKILRQGGTEQPKSDPLWDSTEPGVYCCKGCDLPVYNARWKTVLDIGFLFYTHCEPRSILTAIDKSVYSQLGSAAASMGPVVPDAIPEPDGLSEEELRQLDPLLLIEVHCRRCGSHMGHLVIAQGKLLHCINGSAMNFTPQAA
ncbi:MAG: peptide-methionine (R)-S-oxide reductase [Pseudomonadota bacterium]